MRIRHGLKIISATILLVMLLAPVATSAATQSFVNRIQGGVQDTASPSGLEQTGDLETIIGSIIHVALGLLGIVLFGLLVYAGFLWMTAGGNPEQVKKAKGMIANAIIGLIITVAAYAISDFVLSSLAEATARGGSATVSPATTP